MSLGSPHTEPTRAEIESMAGPTLIEFGSESCGHCLRAQPIIRQALDDTPGLRHLKIEDGRGRPLGRSFGVKLWPTLVLMRSGQEAARCVRPTDVDTVRQLLASIDGANVLHNDTMPTSAGDRE